MIAAAFAGGAAGIGVLFRMQGHRILGIFSKQHRARAEQECIRIGGFSRVTELRVHGGELHPLLTARPVRSTALQSSHPA